MLPARPHQINCTPSHAHARISNIHFTTIYIYIIRENVRHKENKMNVLCGDMVALIAFNPLANANASLHCVVLFFRGLVSFETHATRVSILKTRQRRRHRIDAVNPHLLRVIRYKYNII